MLQNRNNTTIILVLNLTFITIFNAVINFVWHKYDKLNSLLRPIVFGLNVLGFKVFCCTGLSTLETLYRVIIILPKYISATLYIQLIQRVSNKEEALFNFVFLLMHLLLVHGSGRKQL